MSERFPPSQKKVREGKESPAPVLNEKARSELKGLLAAIIAGGSVMTTALPEAQAKFHKSIEETATEEQNDIRRDVEKRINAWRRGNKKVLEGNTFKALRNSLEMEEAEQKAEALKEFEKIAPQMYEMNPRIVAFFTFVNRSVQELRDGTFTIEIPPHEGDLESRNRENAQIEKAVLALDVLINLRAFMIETTDEVIIPPEKKTANVKGAKNAKKSKTPVVERPQTERVVNEEYVGSNAQVPSRLKRFDEALKTFLALPEWAQKAGFKERQERESENAKQNLFQSYNQRI